MAATKRKAKREYKNKPLTASERRAARIKRDKRSHAPGTKNVIRKVMKATTKPSKRPTKVGKKSKNVRKL